MHSSPYGDTDRRSSRSAVALVAALASSLLLASPAPAADVDLLSPAAPHIDGEDVEDFAGGDIDNAGDVNDDGVDDIIIGAREADVPADEMGAAYVIYGSANPGSVDLDGGPGAAGFQINGAAINDLAGFSVAGAGDVNDDGIDDVIVGTPFAAPFANGAAYVVYGSNAADPLDVDLANLGTQGFVINTDASVDLRALGTSVDGAGFFNQDSIADVVVGDPQGGTTFVIYGVNADDPTDVNVERVAPVGGQNDRGFSIVGAAAARMGDSVAGVGDTAGDGRSDIVIGAPLFDPSPGIVDDAGQAYVVYGEEIPDSDDLDVADLPEPGGFDNHRGYVVTGAAAGDMLGDAVGGVGDFNGQGRPDVIFGAPLTDNAGSNSGSAYIVSGLSGLTGFGDAVADVDLAPGVIDNAWMRIDGVDVIDQTGTGVDAAGDVNGDGVDDAIVGAPTADLFDIEEDGAAYVVFGRAQSDPDNVPLAQVDNGGTADARGMVIFRNQPEDLGFLGSSVASMGDLDGNGRSELLIADQFFEQTIASPDLEEGRVYVTDPPIPSPLAPGQAFGEQAVATQSATRQVTFTNPDNDGFLAISSASLMGADSGQFTLIGDSCSGELLAPEQACNVGVRFDPTSAGAKQALVRVVSNADGSPDDAALSGAGGPPDTAISGPQLTDANPSFTLSSPSAGSSFECSFDLSPFSPCSSPVSFAGLAPGLHVLSVRAVSFGLTDPTPAEHYFFVAAGDAEPVQGETVNLRPVSGQVRVNIPRDGQGFIPIEEALQVAVGTRVDTTNGRVELTSATDEGGTQSAEFNGGLFNIRQGKRDDQTVARLLGRQQCTPSATAGSGRTALASTKRRKPSLWGSGNGNFASSGNHGSASVRGTKWLIFEQCGGITGTFVKQGVVAFRNFYTGRTTFVRKGQTVFARPTAPRSR